MYHFLQALWFPMLVDIKYLELKRRPLLGRLANNSSLASEQYAVPRGDVRSAEAASLVQ